MKKLIFNLWVLALIFCAVPVHGDTPEETQREIPMKKLQNTSLNRSLNEIRAYYDVFASSVTSHLSSDLGMVEMIITNFSTGEQMSYVFDSSYTLLISHPISGDPGYYEVMYRSENGSCYQGNFIIY